LSGDRVFPRPLFFFPNSSYSGTRVKEALRSDFLTIFFWFLIARQTSPPLLLFSVTQGQVFDTLDQGSTFLLRPALLFFPPERPEPRAVLETVCRSAFFSERISSRAKPYLGSTSFPDSSRSRAYPLPSPSLPLRRGKR